MRKDQKNKNRFTDAIRASEKNPTTRLRETLTPRLLSPAATAYALSNSGSPCPLRSSQTDGWRLRGFPMGDKLGESTASC